jgi:diaminopimelate epimerase
MTLIFHKMHGAGNDFVLLDLRKQTTELTPGFVRDLADRKTGVGFDQLLVILEPRTAKAIAQYDIWNTDGSKAAQCGNGARCIGLYLQQSNETGTGSFSLDSPSGLVTINPTGEKAFEVDMGAPRFSPSEVPTTLDSEDGWYALHHEGQKIRLGAVSMGNPHSLMLVDDIETAPVAILGPVISTHANFPKGCNAGFAQIIDRNNVRLRVYERGVGETQACGSGACAAMVWLCHSGLVDEEVRIHLPGGQLLITWRKDSILENSAVSMTGPADHVFTGELQI